MIKKDKEQILDEVLILINQFRKKNKSNWIWEKSAQDFVKNKIGNFYDKKEPIKFLIPCLPFKSGNKRDKVIGEIPDEGELLSLYYIDYLMATIENVYPFGSYFYILREGVFMTDIVFIDDEVSKRYTAELVKLFPKHIKLLEPDVLGDTQNYPALREKFIKDYCWDKEDAKEQIKTNEEAKMRLKGDGLSFLEEELALIFETLPQKDMKAKLEEKMIEWVTRDVGLGKFFEKNYGEYLRVSRHPQKSDSPKIGIPLYAGGNDDDVPWHRVLLKKYDGSFCFIKRKDGINNPKYRLIEINNGESGYFVEVE